MDGGSWMPAEDRMTVATLILLVQPVTFAQQEVAAPLPVDLGRALEEIRTSGEVPALGGALWRDGHLVAAGVAGVRKAGDPTRVTLDDRWHLGSNTKAMTATLVGIYVDRGLLRFDRTLGEIFAEERLHPGYATVTLEQLLQHRGGMPANPKRSELVSMFEDGTPGALGPTVLAALSRAPASPLGQFQYSNLGYMTVGFALERLTGKPWQQQMQEELFLPLQMTSCGFGPPSGADVLAQPWGHTGRRRSTPVPPDDPQSDNPPALGPAGTVHCSMEDWGRFLALHLGGARGESTTQLEAETLKRLQTPSSGSYAAGWVVEAPSWAGGPALTHEGSNTCWYATVWIVPERDAVFVAVANAASPGSVSALGKALSLLVERYVLEPP